MSENQTDKDFQIDLETLHQKSVKDLKAIAKAMGLKGVSTLRKQGIIDRIRDSVGQKSSNNHKDSSDPKEEMQSSNYGQQSHIQTYDEKPNRKKSSSSGSGKRQHRNKHKKNKKQ